MAIVAPSILAANFLDLGADIELINKSEADLLHVDVMDGNFVPNISFGQAIVSKMKSACEKPLDVHLMIENPELYIEEFKAAGADYISIHAEATKHLHRAIHQIKETGAKSGVAINPHTSIENIVNVLEDVDLVVVMSVNPGFGGQKFIYNSLSKIRSLHQIRTKHNYSFQIEVDGGVGLQNAEKILKAGADILVAGSSVFKSDDPTQTISRFKAMDISYTEE